MNKSNAGFSKSDTALPHRNECSMVTNFYKAKEVFGSRLGTDAGKAAAIETVASLDLHWPWPAVASLVFGARHPETHSRDVSLSKSCVSAGE
jgi:hypothetical protein